MAKVPTVKAIAAKNARFIIVVFSKVSKKLSLWLKHPRAGLAAPGRSQEHDLVFTLNAHARFGRALSPEEVSNALTRPEDHLDRNPQQEPETTA